MDDGLVLRIEQGGPMAVTPVGEDRFESSHPLGWGMVSLEFKRNPAKSVAGFSLSSGSERGILFERR